MLAAFVRICTYSKNGIKKGHWVADEGHNKDKVFARGHAGSLIVDDYLVHIHSRARHIRRYKINIRLPYPNTNSKLMREIKLPCKHSGITHSESPMLYRVYFPERCVRLELFT